MSNFEEILNDSLIFTGAGFSKPAGCKLSFEMLKDLENKSNDENSKIFTTSERKAIKFILSCLDYQARYRTLESNGKYSYFPNIEEFAQLLRRIRNRENLLPYPVTGNWSDKITMIEQDFKIEVQNPEKDIWSSIEDKIKDHCYKEWLSNDNSNKEYLNPLKEYLKKLRNNQKIEIFTLNNDLVLENFFSDENSLYTGFVSNKWVGFERENIDDDTFNASRINYYKLHGSMDWIRLSDGSIIKNQNNSFDESNIEISPFLIFGHGTKIYTIDPFFSLLEYFRLSLRKKKYFFIVGYSFFDPHINNLLFYELSINPDKFMLIINPKIIDDLNDEDFKNKCKKDVFNIENVLVKSAKQKLVEYFNNVQQNPIYTELPDFNIRKISSESFEYIKTTTDDFIKNFENFLGFVSQHRDNKQTQVNIF
ncbi:MAG: SIR2 family protein [Melioribacteraceae bacterium]|nr:SIR2 family protein [Melioribacteraceae bacterium]